MNHNEANLTDYSEMFTIVETIYYGLLDVSLLFSDTGTESSPISTTKQVWVNVNQIASMV